MNRLHWGALVTAALLGSCTAATHQDTTPDEGEVQTTTIAERLLRARSCYRFEADGEPQYMSSTATVQMLDRFGDHDLKPLHAALVSAVAGDRPARDIDDAIQCFVTDTAYLEGLPGIVLVDSIPRDSADGAWYCEISLKINELTHSYATYRTSSLNYTGGAHPATDLSAFTYVFDTSELLTMDNLFVEGSKRNVLATATDILRRRLGPGAKRLSSYGYFVDTLPEPGSISLEGGMIVLRYGRYEIGPYVMGVTEVELSPGAVEQWLTPLAKELIGD